MQELGLSYLRLAFHQQSLLCCKASELFISWLTILPSLWDYQVIKEGIGLSTARPFWPTYLEDVD